MSEISSHRDERVTKLIDLFEGILNGENVGHLVAENSKLIQSVIPSDIILLVDRLVILKMPMDDLKKGINKLLNLLHKTISNHVFYPPGKESFLGVMVENNRLLDARLKEIRPLLRDINGHPENIETKKLLYEKFMDVEKYNYYYSIKENVLFPLIEKHVPDYRCLSVMWSFHDDIKNNLKKIVEELGREKLDLRIVNRLSGDLFFSMYAIKFREERILFPLVQEMVSEVELNSLFAESLKIGFPYFQPEIEFIKDEIGPEMNSGINLETGSLSLEQIKLLFNHLPVDITFVDEYDKVVYFSSPKTRIFTRTKSIIGRDVHNCHPPESVHVVEEIIKNFRNGKRDVASFWIKLKGNKILIQYFAVRDHKGNYKGVIEVAQEITYIQNMSGEKRLLDWNGG